MDPNPLSSIGQKLKSARESQGLSLRQIYERTKIPVGHLLSIESGLVDELPEPVYVSGFIKRFGDCVGIDGQSLAEDYRQQADLRQFADDRKTGGHSTGSKAPYLSTEYLTPIKISQDPPILKTIYFNAVWIVVVVGLISYLWWTQTNNQLNREDSALLELRQSAQRYHPQAQAMTANHPEQSATPSGSPISEDTGKLSLTASQHVWVEVKADSTGENLFTGYLEQGDRRDFQDPQGLSVRAGNGGSLSVTWKGKNESFGEPDKVSERAFIVKPAVATTEAVNPVTPAAKDAANSSPKKAQGVQHMPGQRTSGRLLAKEGRYRKVDDVPSRQYLPGESLTGVRTIDVPYRYSEGRLDAD